MRQDKIGRTEEKMRNKLEEFKRRHAAEEKINETIRKQNEELKIWAEPKAEPSIVDGLLNINDDTVMDINGFQACIMQAEKLQDCGRAHGLPPGEAVKVYPIETVPGAPEHWKRENGCYIVPVNPNCGLWFNWTMNDALNTAIVCSVKGMNPITGQAMEGAQLEAYLEKCPIHGEKFMNSRHCPKCGFDWPTQNFISAPNTLWWDGFRQPDGKVRQFFFSADEARDIASLVIGKENTLPAFGFAFYKPKVVRAKPQEVIKYIPGQDIHHYHYDTWGYWQWWYNQNHYHYHTHYSNPVFGDVEKHVMFPNNYTSNHLNDGGTSWMVSNNSLSADGSFGDGLSCSVGAKGVESNETLSVRSKSVLRSNALHENDSDEKSFSAPSAAPMVTMANMNATVAVGAGAEIAQDLRPDALGIEGWQEKPSGVIRLYFCFQDQFNQYVKRGGGVKELKKRKQGFLQGLPVGD